MHESRTILKFFKRDPGIRYALATVVRVFGSSYRSPGAKMIISEGGEISGSISGGCLERDLIRRALVSIRDQKPALIRYDTRAEATEDDNDQGEFLVQTAGLGCEGVIEIYLEPNPSHHIAAIERCLTQDEVVAFEINLPDGETYPDIITPPCKLVIFGAGPDIVAMIEIGHALGWDITVVDCKSSFPVPKRLFQKADRILSLSPERVLENLKLDERTFVALMTHNFEHDQLILEQLATVTSIKYLGLLGPKVRGEKLLRELQARGVSLQAENIHYPMGLDIGGDNSQAIALSAYAEMQSILSKRSGTFLKDRTTTIHSSSKSDF